jgi:hypothetical protein
MACNADWKNEALGKCIILINPPSKFADILTNLVIINKLFCTGVVLGQFDTNGTAHFKKCKQLFEYKHLLLLRDIYWSKF